MSKQLLILTDANGDDFACFADSWRILPKTGGLLEIVYLGQITGMLKPWEYIGGISSYDWDMQPVEDMEFDDEPELVHLDTEWIN